MPVWLKNKLRLFFIITNLCVGLISTPLSAADITVNYANSKIVNGIYLVDANLSYDLGDKTIEALKSGIPLPFYLEVEFIRPRNYIWDAQVFRYSQDLRLQYHPLSGQYVVTNMVTTDQFSFQSLDEALLRLGKISNLPVAESVHIDTSQQLVGQIRSGLDIEALPTPMRLQAWISSEWRVSSDWYEWKVVP